VPASCRARRARLHYVEREDPGGRAPRPRGTTTTIMPPRNSAMPPLTSPGPAFSRHPVHTGATRSKTPDRDHHRISNGSLPGSLDNRLLTLVRCGDLVADIAAHAAPE
jgi:hypothetical protein